MRTFPKSGLLRVLDVMFVPTSLIRFLREEVNGIKPTKRDYIKMTGLEVGRLAAYAAPFISNYLYG